MFERFTRPARRAVVAAQRQARELGHDHIGTEHLLLGLLAEEGDVAARVLAALGVRLGPAREQVAALGASDSAALRALGIDLDAVRGRAEAAFGPGALDRRLPRRRLFRRRRGPGPARHLPVTDGTKRALEQALREALGLRHGYIGTEHLLLGLIAAERDPVEHVLRGLGVTLDRPALRRRVLDELGRAA